MMAVVTAVTVLMVFLMSKPISAYQLGEGYAQNMGVNIKLFRVALILLSSIFISMRHCICRTHILCRNCGASSGKKFIKNSPAPSGDPGLFSGRSSILSFL